MYKEKFLATTALDSFWDKEKEILFLGEWCKLYNYKDIYKTLNYETLDFLWENHDQVDKAWEKYSSLYPIIISKLTNILNNYHVTNQSEQYWDILLSPWLTRYIQIVYDKYMHIKLAQQKYTLYSYTLSTQNYQYINTAHSFIRNIENNDEYNLQIYSQIISFLNIKHYDKDYKPKPLDYNIHMESSPWRKKAKKLSFLIHKKHKHSNSIMVVNPYFKFDYWKNLKKLALKTQMRYYFNDFEYDIEIPITPDKLGRKSIFSTEERDQFINLLFATLEYNFPTIYLEGYKQFNARVNDLNIEIPNAIVTANSIHYNEIFKFFIAKNKSKTKLFYLQHGGGYGIDKVALSEKIERRFADKFFTYGWSDNKNTIPISIPQYQFQQKKHNDNITLILTTMSRYPNGFFYNGSSTNLLKLIKSTEKFLLHLNNRDNLTIREYPMEFGWNIKQRLLEKNKDIHFNNDINYYEQITHSKLNIYNHMHTGYLESMSMNIPTIIIIPMDTYSFRDMAQPFIELLIKNNILFTNPIDAATFINTNISTIDKWWFSENIQVAREKFCNQYVKVSKNWEENWITSIDQSLSF